MSTRVQEDFGTGKKNEAVEVGRIKSIGPVTLVAHSQSPTAKAVLSVENNCS